MAASPHHHLTVGPPRRRITHACAVAGVGCLVAGGVLLASGGPGPVDVGALPPAHATTAPSAPVVAGTVPVEIALPGRNVTAPVTAVGTDAFGGLVIPEPPLTVGWWSPSALSGGATGPTVLAGHVDSATAGLGALEVLRDVAVGESVVVRGSDGRTIGYRVTARREYRKAELPAALFATGGPPELVLITCGGRFDRATGHYESNVVVHAAPA